ncbi:MAG: uracil-DNA glycosylase, partial [Phreatobacter sp.]
MTLSLTPDAIEALLVFYRDAGVDMAVGEEAVDRFAEADAEAARRREALAARQEAARAPALARP